MEEIELKVLEIDKQEILDKLESLGAEALGEKMIRELHFDFNDNKIKSKGDLLRLRKFGDKNEIVYKENHKDPNFLMAEEIETEVNDFDTEEYNLLSFNFGKY